MEKSAYIWYVPQERSLHAAALARRGVDTVYIKAGGDASRLWAQWADPDVVQPYKDAGLAVHPWYYVWPGDLDRDIIRSGSTVRYTETVVLNPETEWRVQSSENGFRTLDEANLFAADWVAKLRGMLPRGARIGFSGVPSWADFPYEGFARACDFAMPQHYWPRTMLRGEDQVAAHVRRGGLTLDCVPILTACREYDDQGVVELATAAIAEFPQLDGLSAWEAGNPSFQYDAIERAFRLLPADSLRPLAGAPDEDEPLANAYHELRDAATEYKLADPVGLALYRATGDLTPILPELPRDAPILVCEKAVLWAARDGSVQTFHRGQFEALAALGRIARAA